FRAGTPCLGGTPDRPGTARPLQRRQGGLVVVAKSLGSRMRARWNIATASGIIRTAMTLCCGEQAVEHEAVMNVVKPAASPEETASRVVALTALPVIYDRPVDMPRWRRPDRWYLNGAFYVCNDRERMALQSI